jgi:hypothetical protein
MMRSICIYNSGEMGRCWKLEYPIYSEKG